MDEKTDTMLPITRNRLGGRARLFIAVFFLSFWLLMFYHLQPLYGNSATWEGDWTIVDIDDAPAGTTNKLVPVEAHIMSKCPDARASFHYPYHLGVIGERAEKTNMEAWQDCLRQMVLPAMQRVSDKVNFTLSFIGTYVAFNPFLCPPVYVN